MRRTYLLPVCALIATYLSLAPISLGQTASNTTDPEAVAIVRAAIAEMSHGISVNDLTLTGVAQLAPGDTSASTTIKIRGTCEASIAYSAGPRQGERYNDCELPSGAWQDSSGIQHELAFHNSLIPSVVLDPLALLNSLLLPQSVVQYVGQETLEGSPVSHLHYFRTRQAKSSNPHLVAMLQHLSTVDLYLTSSNTLAAIKFDIHPNDNALVDIPTEVRFGNYRTVEGILMPFQIQRFMYGSLIMDLTVSDAKINAGLTDAEFAVN